MLKNILYKILIILVFMGTILLILGSITFPILILIGGIMFSIGIMVILFIVMISILFDKEI